MKQPKILRRTATLKPVPYAEEMFKLRQIYLRAEEKIISEIARKQARGFVTYGEHLALERVQKTLQGMMDATWEYVPRLIEKQYLYGKISELGYKNAGAFTTTDLNVISRLVTNLMGELTEAVATAQITLQATWQESVKIARLEQDVFRTSALEGLTVSEAAGMGRRYATDIFLEKVKENGITAFTDKSGRKWSLNTYGDMATRTTSRQATNLGTLMADEEHDLYQISSHGSTCPVCAPLEGRVYSRSGTNPNYPPLASAFGKIDASGPDSLENSYLNIHPNCLHVLTRFSEEGKTPEQVDRIRQFSDFESNPRSHDPRSEAQIKAYRDKEKGREKLLADIKQFERYKTVLGDKVPKTFATFQKHKLADGDLYRQWQEQYRAANRAMKPPT